MLQIATFLQVLEINCRESKKSQQFPFHDLDLKGSCK